MGVILTGTLTCSEEDARIVRDVLPEHIRLSRTEPGCVRFEVAETQPGVFAISEEFIDRAAFEAHQTRTRASAWWAATSHIPRAFDMSDT